MAELKTQQTKIDPKKFLETVQPDQKRVDAGVLLEMFQKATGKKPVMWGENLVGFGKYHYKSERSAQKGDWPLVAFSPRKQNLSLYIMNESIKSSPLFDQLGKYKASVGCLYINKLSDVDLSVLSELVKKSFDAMKSSHAG